MSKRILFRLHGKHAEAVAQNCKEFVKGYFANHNKRVRLSVEIFNPEWELFASPRPYDLIIDTASDETEHIAHAAGWSYLVGIDQAEGLYYAACGTFHNNQKLADEITKLEPFFTKQDIPVRKGE